MLGSGMVTYSDETKTKISDANADTDVQGHGSNLHSGLVLAEQLLSGDEDLEESHKYVILLADAKAYIWNDADNKPIQFYAQGFRNANVRNNGVPYNEQMGGIYNKENKASRYHDVPYETENAFPSFIDHSVDNLTVLRESSDYYQRLYDSTNEELKSATPYGFRLIIRDIPDMRTRTPLQGQRLM